jgi:hypothetical protein
VEGVVSRTLPRLTPVLQTAVLQAVALSDAIYAIYPATTGPSSRENLGAVYCSIALDHREAIILLVRHGAFSSASALARAVYEACIRGLWARFAATEEQLKRVIGQGILPKFETVAKELAAREEMGLLARVRNEVWGLYRNTHTQASARSTSGTPRDRSDPSTTRWPWPTCCC